MTTSTLPPRYEGPTKGPHAWITEYNRGKPAHLRKPYPTRTGLEGLIAEAILAKQAKSASD
jgi:hypothetical protein